MITDRLALYALYALCAVAVVSAQACSNDTSEVTYLSFEHKEVKDHWLKNSQPSLTIGIRMTGQFGAEKELDDANKLEDALEKPLLEAGAGKWVGHETGDGERTVSYEGPSAEKLFKYMRLH